MTGFDERSQGQPIGREEALEKKLDDVLSTNAALTAIVHQAGEKIRLLEEAARKDSLIPELLSKKAITELIEERIFSVKPFGLFLIDLNNFKTFNDTYGHRRGDKMLREVGLTLADGFKRGTDAIGMHGGRIGGDEFIVLVELGDGGKDRAATPQEQMDNTYNFIKGLERQFLEANQSAGLVDVGFAIGGTYYDPEHPVDVEVLLDQADEAMYEEKNDGR